MEEKDIALRIAKLRTKKNVSARERSLAIGQNENYINHIETGRGLPSLSGIIYICEYMGISVSQFFDFENENPARLNNIISLLKGLDDKQLETLETLIKNFKK